MGQSSCPRWQLGDRMTVRYYFHTPIAHKSRQAMILAPLAQVVSHVKTRLQALAGRSNHPI